jgi:D-alanyl-D-alanine carboxypeptidase (penicillin-binding protein 5/6)
VSRGVARRLLATALLCTGALMLAPAGGLAARVPGLSAHSAILIEQSTGQQLYGLHARTQAAIASTTKLMTALLTLEHVHRLGTMFTQNGYYPAAVDSQIGLVPGERMSVHDLLLALLLPSADDAAEDLAFNVGHGSVPRFVAMMNARARELGLLHTHYSTPSGLDTPGNYSTAADLVKLANYDLTHSRYFARVVALPSAVLHSGDYVRHVVNRNVLVGRVPWIDGVKTGHTAAAGYVLVAAGQRDGMTLISAVLGTSSEQARDANTIALLDYGFASFRLETPVRAGEVLARPAVRDQAGHHAVAVAAASLHRVLPRRDSVTVTVQIPRQLAGPRRRGARVGTAVVLADGRLIDRIPLVLARALPAAGALTLAGRYLPEALLGLGIVVALGAVVLLAVRRRRRTRSAAGAWEAA